jgi:hypothetical protein
VRRGRAAGRHRRQDRPPGRGGHRLDRRPPAQGPSPGLTRVGALIIEPTAGFSPVYSLINGARRSIDVTIYEFADTTAEHDLAAAAKRGVQVHVILDEWEESLNSNTFSYLSSHRVKVVWSSSRFTYTHQKTVVVDGSKAVIMTANLTSKYYPTSRDFLVVDTNRADVAAITAVFDRLLHPREGHRGRLRHRAREDVRRIGELFPDLPRRQPRARPDHLRPRGLVRDGPHLSCSARAGHALPASPVLHEQGHASPADGHGDAEPSAWASVTKWVTTVPRLWVPSG